MTIAQTTTPSAKSPEAAAHLQARVALVGKVLTVVFAVMQLALTAITAAYGNAGHSWLHPAHLLGWLGVLSAAVMWASCGTGTRSRRFVYAVETVCLLAGTLATAFMGRHLAFVGWTEIGQVVDLEAQSAAARAWYAGLLQIYVVMALMLGLMFCFALRAALVPSTPLRTAVLTGSAGILLLVVSALGWVPLAADRVLRDSTPSEQVGRLVVAVVIWWLAVTVICTVLSKVIHNLQRQIRHAMRLGQYTLELKLGEGGMGEVYRAHHALMRRPTAIKLLPASKAGEASLPRFEREVQLTAKLTHPNTITIYDYGRTPDGVLYYAMELLNGATLEQVVEHDGPQPPGRVLRVLIMVAGALTEAHAIGLIHRDVKPANIFLCEQGGEFDVAKVLDFGLVKAVSGADKASLTQAGIVTGTPLYMPPEALADPDKMDGRSDLYSLGAVGYYMLTGSVVFDGKTVVEICGHHLHTEPELPSRRLGKPVPSDLEAIIMDCLAKDRQARPESARALRTRLEQCRDLGSWDQDSARAWWDDNGDTLQAARPSISLESAATVAVDMSHHHGVR